VVEDGRLIGIITRADLVRAYLRSDTELLATIRDDVLLKAMWLDPSGFEIDVQRGEASIRGHVERRSMVPILEEAIAAVPGIVSVTVDLTWALDDRALEPASVDAVFPHGIV
jgi:CBS domain-containing protein